MLLFSGFFIASMNMNVGYINYSGYINYFVGYADCWVRFKREK